MPLLPLYSFELMNKELVALDKILESLKDKIPEDDFLKMREHIEAINKEIRSARF
ncbi:hypothetical protein ES702_01375 [subsurface metagenome]